MPLRRPVLFCAPANKSHVLPVLRAVKYLDGLHPDVHTVKPEKNMLKVDQVRAVISTVYETPYEGGAKIYVIHDFHLANEQAQNALLKTLEEPPASVVFFLLAENSLQLLPTVRSRCRKIRLTGYGEAQILQQLERLFPQNGRNTYAARECGGNIGTAVGLVTDEELIRLHDLARELVTGIEGGIRYPGRRLCWKRKRTVFYCCCRSCSKSSSKSCRVQRIF